MDMDSSNHINATVRDLLNKLVDDYPHYRWESLCAYSDGREKTILEITIYSNHGNRQMGKITYQLETTEVLNVHYLGYHNAHPDSIIDLLLDIMNIVKTQESAA